VANAEAATYQNGTAVIAARDVNVQVTNDILNQGTIVAGDVNKIAAN
jgi:hypothetical protein